MIYTVTLNPSIDYVVKVEDFRLGTVNRVNTDYKYPGGKGINVSRVLKNMGIKSKALGFIGGFTGAYIKKYLEAEGIETDFITVKGDTRINIKLKADEETEINGAGPDITEENINVLFEKISKLTSNDYLVLAGNIQKSLSRDIYSKIQEKCISNDVKVVVDTTGESLIVTLKYHPFLIKPNKEELEEIFGVEMNTQEEIILYAKKLRDMGAQNVIISMAGEGALLICKNGVYHGSVPKGVVKNSVGAGDSLIAGFIASYSQNLDIEKAFKMGIASGSATAFSLDLCKREDVEKLLDQVKINKI
ncbi:1-phosphofructokinase [Crassaminicella thermophila]|uniref:Tagatose-6-phosphate kinase n=1 Tax=Crassaminicella thermophila TaxID=2599308 RepID=A0A5C0SII4_CRATE|nr:1-phosphofructokinase [Crassaminicella thermophila]QEK13018.1 1-phosphofructokinase [Crassaminicella thermophila]